MQVLFKTRDTQAQSLRDGVEDKVRFALRRLSGRVPRAEVHLSDLNGPRGGVDKRVQIALQTDGAGPVVVSSVGRDWRSALDAALARAARLLLRLWRRGQPSRRGPRLKALPESS